MGQTLSQKVVKGALWALLTTLSMRLFSFVVTLVLARLLTPSDYGTISLLTVFISVASTFAESGFGKALIQKKNATQVDFNTVFYTSLVVSGVIYCILFGASPWVARFYRMPELTSVMRVLSLSLVFNAISGVQNAELSREMRFDVGFRVSLVAHVCSAVVGVSLAFLGYGPWAIVWSQMASSLASICMLWLLIAWRPSLQFSWVSLKELLGFGWKLTISSLIDTAYRNLYGFLVGRLYSKEDLAFVEKGQTLPQLAMDVVNGPINRVMYPALAKLQDDTTRFQMGMRRMIKVSTFFVFPVMCGIAVCARQITLLMYGNQWLGSVPYVELACFSFALWPLHVINLHAISARGRSDVYLALEIIKKVIGLTLVLISIRYGVFCLMATLAFVNGPLGLIVNAWPNRKLLGYSLEMQLRDVLPTVAICTLMCGAVWGLSWLLADLPWLLALQIPLGVIVFVAAAFCFRLDAAKEAVSIAKPILGCCGPLHRSVVVARIYRWFGV